MKLICQNIKGWSWQPLKMLEEGQVMITKQKRFTWWLEGFPAWLMRSPLSTWIVVIHSSGDEQSRLSSGRLVNGWNEERGLVAVPVESLAIGARGRSRLDDDQSLPLVKKSPVWRMIESIDVFQIVPQKPHFQPLAENREEFCEGSAIGIMVTFAGLFEKISMLHFDDHRNTYDSILESLNDLE